MVSDTAVVVANGPRPRKAELRYLLKHFDALLVCADGGADSVKSMGLKPDIIVGDLDSVSPATLRAFSRSAIIVKYGRQSDTDAEKAIKYLLRKRVQHIILTGVIGSRLDHSLANLNLLARYQGKCRLSLLSEGSLLTVITQNTRVRVLPGEIISFYSFMQGSLVSCTGLKYKMRNYSLSPGGGESTSNVVSGSTVEITVHAGACMMVRSFRAYRQANA